MKKNMSASSNRRVRRAEVTDSSSSEDGSDEDEMAVSGANLGLMAEAAVKLKKRSNITTAV
jgi:hypothetical protein